MKKTKQPKATAKRTPKQKTAIKTLKAKEVGSLAGGNLWKPPTFPF